MTSKSRRPRRRRGRAEGQSIGSAIGGSRGDELRRYDFLTPKFAADHHHSTISTLASGCCSQVHSSPASSASTRNCSAAGNGRRRSSYLRRPIESGRETKGQRYETNAHKQLVGRWQERPTAQRGDEPWRGERDGGVHAGALLNRALPTFTSRGSLTLSMITTAINTIRAPKVASKCGPQVLVDGVGRLCLCRQSVSVRLCTTRLSRCELVNRRCE
jgi:hypothetical protein